MTFNNCHVWFFTQIQLADEKSTIKALRKRQEKDREEMEKDREKEQKKEEVS